MADITSDEINDLARTPERARTDEGTVQERKVEEMLKADAYTRTGAASAVPWGMRIARTQPPGTV